MATAVATVTVTETWFDGHLFHALGTIAVDASPATYSTGGISMPLNQDLIKAQRPPLKVEVKGIFGYQFAYIPGSNVSNGLLKILNGTTQLVDASAIPATISGDSLLQFEAVWKGFN